MALSNQWKTATQLAQKSHISLRSARHFAKRYAELGIVDREFTFPEYSYRRASSPPPESLAFSASMENAVKAYLEKSLTTICFDGIVHVEISVDASKAEPDDGTRVFGAIEQAVRKAVADTVAVMKVQHRLCKIKTAIESEGMS